MNKKLLNYLLFIIIASILLYFARNNYKEFNINKAISACILAQKQTSTNFDKDIVRKKCEEEIQKSINN
jgi:hypothetical protein